MVLSIRHIWSWLRDWPWSISQHLIILRSVVLLKVSLLAYILVKVLLWLHLLHYLFLSLIHYWHLHLLLVLSFLIIFPINAEGLYSVTTWIVFRRFGSLNSFITGRLIISEISLLRRSNFLSVLFDLRSKTWNMIILFFLFN